MLPPVVEENKTTSSKRRNRTIVRALGTTCLVGLLGLVACGTSTPPARHTQRLTIAWIPKALNNPVFELGRAGALERGAEMTAARPGAAERRVFGSGGRRAPAAGG